MTISTLITEARGAWNWIVTESCLLVHGCVAHPICSVMNTTAAFMRFVDAPTWASWLEAASDVVHDGTMPVGVEPRNVDRKPA